MYILTDAQNCYNIPKIFKALKSNKNYIFLYSLSESKKSCPHSGTALSFVSDAAAEIPHGSATAPT